MPLHVRLLMAGIVSLSAMAVVGCSEHSGGSGARPSLRLLCERSECIYTIEVVVSREDRMDGRIIDVLKGQGDPPEVSIQCESQEGFDASWRHLLSAGDSLLVFLVPGEDGVHSETFPGWSFECPEEADLPLFVEAARSWLAMQSLRGDELEAAENDWLIRLLENPRTSWDATVDLMRGSPVTDVGRWWRVGERFDIDRDFIDTMSSEQIRRVVRVLCDPLQPWSVRTYLPLVLQRQSEEGIEECIVNQLLAVASPTGQEARALYVGSQAEWPIHLAGAVGPLLDCILKRRDSAALRDLVEAYEQCTYPELDRCRRRVLQEIARELM